MSEQALNSEEMRFKDYYFCSPYCSLVVTTLTEEDAVQQLKDAVKQPFDFNLAHVEEVQQP